MPATSQKQACKPGFERAYHVDWDEGRDRWDVIDETGRVHGHCHNLQEATELAVREAHNDHAGGADVIVCIQQSEGGYAIAWSSR